MKTKKKNILKRLKKNKTINGFTYNKKKNNKSRKGGGKESIKGPNRFLNKKKEEKKNKKKTPYNRSSNPHLVSSSDGASVGAVLNGEVGELAAPVANPVAEGEPAEYKSNEFGQNTQNEFNAHFASTQEVMANAAEDQIRPLFEKIKKDGGYSFLDISHDIDKNKPIRPFVLSAHSSGQVKELKDVIVWKNELDIPIFIVLYSKHGDCGITHFEDLLTRRMVGLDLLTPQEILGYKEVFEKYNKDSEETYEKIMYDFFTNTLYHEQPNVKPSLQPPLIIRPKEEVTLAVDFYGGDNISEPHGWLADVFDQEVGQDPKFLIDKRFKEGGIRSQEIKFKEILDEIVNKIIAIPEEQEQPKAIILFMGCCRGSGGFVDNY